LNSIAENLCFFLPS